MFEHSFVKRFVNLVTGQKAIEVMTLRWIWAVVAAQAASSLYSGYKSGQALTEGGELARDAAFGNAADLRELAGFNSEGYREAGAVNAGAIRTVGYANAAAIENATARNMMMYGMQADEDRRRHVISQKMTAGQIRAMGGASGTQTNTGSPLHYLNSQVMLGIQERRFGDIKAYWTLRNMFEEGSEKAAVTRLTADQQAMVTEYNANLQAEMSYAEAMRQATALERSGEVSAQVGAAQGSAAMWGGISGAISSVVGGYASFGSPFTSPSTNAYATGAMSTYNQSTSWMSPSSSYGQMFGYQSNSPYFTSSGTYP